MRHCVARSAARPRRSQGRLIPRLIGRLLPALCIVVAAPSAVAQDDTAKNDVRKVPEGRTTYRISAEDLADAERKLSSTLRELRQAYRLAGLSPTDAQRRERMARLAELADARIAAAPEVEQLLFLRLAQDSYAEAGNMERAFARMTERADRLEGAEPSDSASRELLAESALAQVKKRFVLAHGLAQMAADAAASVEQRNHCRLERGRIYESESGPAAAGEYYIDLSAGAEDDAFACSAKLLGAKALRRADQMERAIRILDEIISLYPESPTARDSQTLRDDWLNPGDE